MASALRDGFATASTDTGHTAAEPAAWLEDRERLIDYSYRGLHLTTVNAKAILQSYYSQPAKYAYYTGCSTGGKQGLMEAQRYPADFDGILAGDAANYWTHQMASEVWNGVVTSSPETNLPKDKLQLVQDRVMAACDTLDGAKDGIISDPMHCHFDPGVLQCAGPDSANCLTAAQVTAVRDMYSGPRNPLTREPIYAGMYPGGEMGWASGVGDQPDHHVRRQLERLLGLRAVSQAGLGVQDVRLRARHRARRQGARADHQCDRCRTSTSSGSSATRWSTTTARPTR